MRKCLMFLSSKIASFFSMLSFMAFFAFNLLKNVIFDDYKNKLNECVGNITPHSLA